MKRLSIFLASFMAASALLVSCTEEEINKFLDDTIGKAELTVEEVNQPAVGDLYLTHVQGGTITFHSAFADAEDNSTLTLDGNESNVSGLLALGSGSKITTNSAELGFPIFTTKLTGSAEGSYTIDSPLTGTDFLSNLSSNWKSLLTSSDKNIFMMLETEDADTVVYLGIGGSIHLNEMPDYGALLSGTFNNVEVYVLNLRNLDLTQEIRDRHAAGEITDAELYQYLNEAQNNQFDSFFPKVILNGTFECLRFNVISLFGKL